MAKQIEKVKMRKLAKATGHSIHLGGAFWDGHRYRRYTYNSKDIRRRMSKRFRHGAFDAQDGSSFKKYCNYVNECL